MTELNLETNNRHFLSFLIGIVQAPSLPYPKRYVKKLSHEHRTARFGYPVLLPKNLSESGAKEIKNKELKVQT